MSAPWWNEDEESAYRENWGQKFDAIDKTTIWVEPKRDLPVVDKQDGRSTLLVGLVLMALGAALLAFGWWIAL